MNAIKPRNYIMGLTLGLVCAGIVQADDLQRIKYNNPGLVVDLGVGLWTCPLPMDFDYLPARTSL